jgi:Ras-related protein Rab-8A
MRNSNSTSHDIKNSLSSSSRTISVKLSEKYQGKIILLGDISVGKSSIMNQFCENSFENNYICSIGVEFKMKPIIIDETCIIDLQIWDTCGQERFRTITRNYYNGKDACILIFDLTKENSFISLSTWLNDIRLFGSKDIVTIVVGNKSDLETDREVDFERGEAFARKYDCDYFEVSAKSGAGLNYMFNILSRNILNKIKKENNVSLDPISLIKNSKDKKKNNCC